MTKKVKIVGLSVLLSVFCSTVWAKKVDVENAEKVVNRYTELQYRQVDRQSIQLRHTKYENTQGMQKSTAVVCYYVFNVGNGFVIVAGDDVVKPILGYSDNGKYDENNLPPAFVYWLDCLQQEILYAVENNLPQTQAVKAMWDNYLSEKKPSARQKSGEVPPLLNTKWNQYAPYNDSCPMDGSNRSVTGCVATAMAQIMKYWEYPAQRATTIPAYTTTTKKFSIPAITGTTTYNWDEMKETTTEYVISAQKTAVATLMYQCGVSVGMDYQSGGSGASSSKVPKSLIDYFGYDASAQSIDRKYYNTTAWEALLKTQLDAGRPVYYSGRNASSGHAFICDGYKDDGTFHFNWGWGGSKDGYFVTSVLEPGTGGAGSGTGTYNLDQSIIINIMPDKGGAPAPAMPKLYTNLSATSQSLDRNQLFDVNASLINAGSSPFSGNLGVAIVDASDNILEIIGYRTTAISTLQSGYFMSSLPIKCGIPANTAPGTYTIRTIVKPVGKNWEVMTGEIGLKDTLRITVKSGTPLPDLSNLRLYGYNPTFSLSTTPIQGGAPLSVEFGLLNDGTGSFFGEMSLRLYDSTGNLVEIIEKLHLVVEKAAYWQKFTFSSSSINAACGDYIMTLCRKTATDSIVKIAPYTATTYLNDMGVTVVGGSGGTPYTITFDMQTTNNMPPQIIGTCDPLPIPDPRTGYTFVGWFTDSAFQHAWTSNYFLTQDTTLYAKWKLTQYSITYILNGGTNNAQNPKNYTIETPDITLLPPTKTNDSFIRWKEGNTIPKGSTENKIFTAEWEGLKIADITSENGKIVIYPNPTTGQLRITNYELRENTVVDISDIYGKCHTLRVTCNEIIDISHLANGIYFLKLTTNESTTVKKIVKH